MPGRNSQVSRIYAVLELLEGAPHGLTVSELSTRLASRGHEASRRTVYRDIEALEQAGFPVRAEGRREDSQGTLWRLERLTRVREHFVLTSRELLALFLARGALAPLKDTPFYEDLNAVFEKIEARIGGKGQEYFRELTNGLAFEPGPRWGLGLDPDVLETVRAACEERHLLAVEYSSASKGETRERLLGPHYLYFARGSLYLVAEDMEQGAVKVFAVPRMRQARMLEGEYEGVVTDPSQFFSSTFGVFLGKENHAVRLRFAKEIAPYVRERRWHETQRVVAESDGAIVLTIETDITPELVAWVLGFGSKVEVLEPRPLKAAVLTAAEAVVTLYKTSSAA